MRRAATAVVALALLGLAGCGEATPTTGEPSDSPATGTSGATPTEETSEPAPEPSESSSEPVEMGTVPAYFVGGTPQGPRLYREFQRAEDTGPGLAGLALLESGPLDPDYRSLWPDGAFTSLSDPEAGIVHVFLADDSFAARPEGLSRTEARLALQQVVHTLQAGFRERLKVQFHLGRDSSPTPRVYGVPTHRPIPNASWLEVLSMVNVAAPEEGALVSGSFTASGIASSFEATVPWEIRRGDEVVERGFTTAEGWIDKLYPWEAEVDVSTLEPGEYSFVAMTDDPTSGETGGPHEDSKTITVE